MGCCAGVLVHSLQLELAKAKPRQTAWPARAASKEAFPPGEERCPPWEGTRLTPGPGEQHSHCPKHRSMEGAWHTWIHRAPICARQQCVLCSDSFRECRKIKQAAPGGLSSSWLNQVLNAHPNLPSGVQLFNKNRW